MDPILDSLNDKQQEAVTTTEGPVLIIAGAGSGKTKALTHRVARLISRGVKPDEILAVTFTNKAAGEMRERIWSLIRGSTLHASHSTLQPYIGTFHAFCASVLREECGKIGFQKTFTIFDSDDSLSLLKEIMKEQNISPKQFPPGMIMHVISGLKNELIDPDTYQRDAGDDLFPRTAGRLYAEYQMRLKRANAFDFDDLLMQTVLLLRDHRDIREKYQKKFRYIHVDEFQDTNASQYLLVRLLAGNHNNIFVIGDDAQSIYSWRGADWRNIFQFEKDWPETKIIFLEQNYRSTETILAAANHLIKNNTKQKEKKLWTDHRGGAPIAALPAPHERAEAALIADEITRLQTEEQREPRDCAVLYRTNAQSRAIEEALFTCSIPYRVIGGVQFFQRKEIKDVIAYLRFLHNPFDHVSLKRIINLPPRGIGRVAFLRYLTHGANAVLGKEHAALSLFDTTIAGLKDAIQTERPSSFLKTLLKKIRYKEYLDDGSDRAEERWENVQELVNFATHFDEEGKRQGMERMLEEIALVSYDDTHEETRENTVSLMTMHAAKGLEFPVVFIAGLEEGIFPHAKSLLDPAALEEERRLCYVGITRAKEKLYLSWAARRLLFGEIQMNIPSRFIGEIPKEYIQWQETDREDEDHEDDSFII